MNKFAAALVLSYASAMDLDSLGFGSGFKDQFTPTKFDKSDYGAPPATYESDHHDPHALSHDHEQQY